MEPYPGTEAFQLGRRLARSQLLITVHLIQNFAIRNSLDCCISLQIAFMINFYVIALLLLQLNRINCSFHAAFAMKNLINLPFIL